MFSSVVFALKSCAVKHSQTFPSVLDLLVLVVVAIVWNEVNSGTGSHILCNISPRESAGSGRHLSYVQCQLSTTRMVEAGNRQQIHRVWANHNPFTEIRNQSRADHNPLNISRTIRMIDLWQQKRVLQRNSGTTDKECNRRKTGHVVCKVNPWLVTKNNSFRLTTFVFC